MESEIQGTRDPECLLCAGECPECGFDIDGMRARVAELEAKLEESERERKIAYAHAAYWEDEAHSLGGDLDTEIGEHEETRDKLAAATKRAGEEQDGN